MKEPRKFPKVLTGVMLFLMGGWWNPNFPQTFSAHLLWLSVLFCGGGVMSYLTFGAEVQTVVIVNLDTTSKLTQAVRSSPILFAHPS